MTQRLLSKMKWFLILAVYTGPNWNPVKGGSVRTPPKNPSTIEAQAKFFQDFFSVQLSPYKIEFGHVCEDPNTWQQRYEKKDFKNHRDMGKVRWGDKHGGYGEHYWDLNHAGHAADHDGGFEGNSDDGSYHENDNNDVYEEPSEYSPTYDDGYDPEKAAAYDESGRIKRAHIRSKPEKQRYSVQDEDNIDENDDDVEEVTERPQIKRKAKPKQNHNKHNNNDEVLKNNVKIKVHRNHDRPQEKYEENQNAQDDKKQAEKKQVVLVVTHKNNEGQEDNPHRQTQIPEQYRTPSQNPSSYVPYEGGSGVRQHRLVETSVRPQIPRLFLEPSTGHIVDRATGQAFVLQPIADANYN